MLKLPYDDVPSYNDAASRYLGAGHSADVSDYYSENIKDSVVPVTVGWLFDFENITLIRLEYATLPDYTDVCTVELSPNVTEYHIYNLYKATAYYVRVSAYSDDRLLATETGSFRTVSLGPRVMHVEGIYNVRDLGGYITASGKEQCREFSTVVDRSLPRIYLIPTLQTRVRGACVRPCA